VVFGPPYLESGERKCLAMFRDGFREAALRNRLRETASDVVRAGVLAPGSTEGRRFPTCAVAWAPYAVAWATPCLLDAIPSVAWATPGLLDAPYAVAWATPCLLDAPYAVA
jgi:hypothetical protein